MLPSPLRRFASATAVAQYVGMAGVLALLALTFGSLSDSFFRPATVALIANRIPDLTVVAVGMTFVLIIGGIDLSVGSLLAFGSGVLGVLMVDHQWPLGMAAIVAILAVGVLGCINGLISVGARIPSFIVTLGMLEMARGGAYLLTDSQTKYIGSRVEVVGTPLPWLGLSPAFLLAVAVVLSGQWILSRTVFGRYCIAIGTNAEAVRMSGIGAAPYSVAVFILSGLLCGIAAVMHASRLSTADPNAAIGLELSAIAACVIGGTSLMGGRGSVINTFFGVLIIAVLETGLASVGASDPTKRIITGGVIIIAVLLDALRTRWSNRSA